MIKQSIVENAIQSVCQNPISFHQLAEIEYVTPKCILKLKTKTKARPKCENQPQ